MNQRAVSILILLGIAMLGLAIRVAQLGENPAGFFRDEADKGYTAYSLLQTGCDPSGAAFPLFVKSFNVTTSSLYQYIDMPFVAALGLNEFSVRLPAALAGTASILAAFLIANALWGAPYGLWAALLVCLSPWSILLSRWANQSILLTLFVPLGVYFFLGEKDRAFPSLFNAACSAIFFLLALYTYAPARLYIPVFCALLIGLSWLFIVAEKRPVKPFIAPAALFMGLLFLGALPLAYHILFERAESGARFSSIMIFRGQGFAALLSEWLHNYLLHISPGFLFIHGDQNLRHSTAVYGQLHWHLLPLLIAGLIGILRERSRINCVLLAWLLCFPVSAAFTWESIPHALRSVFAVPSAHIVAVFGLKTLIDHRAWLESKSSAFLAKALSAVWLASLILLPSIYFYDLFARYPHYSAAHWEYGYKDAIAWWQKNRMDADQTTVSGIAEYPHIFFLFYTRYDPQNWIDAPSIPGVEFLPLGAPVRSVSAPAQGRALYLVRPDELAQYQAEKVILLPQRQGDLPMPVWKWILLQQTPNQSSP